MSKKASKPAIGHNDGPAIDGDDLRRRAHDIITEMEAAEKLVEQRAELNGKIKDKKEAIAALYATAKSAGYDREVLKAAIKRMRTPAEDRQMEFEFNALVEVYADALGVSKPETYTQTVHRIAREHGIDKATADKVADDGLLSELRGSSTAAREIVDGMTEKQQQRARLLIAAGNDVKTAVQRAISDEPITYDNLTDKVVSVVDAMVQEGLASGGLEATDKPNVFKMKPKRGDRGVESTIEVER